MANKRTLHQDPEYDDIPTEVQEKRIKLIEDNVRKQNRKKIEAIIKSNFDQEIPRKNEEIDKIDELLHEARSTLDRLRACAVTKFYATVAQDEAYSEKYSASIHPSVKKYLGKTPRYTSSNLTDNQENTFQTSAQNGENVANNISVPIDERIKETNDTSEKEWQSNNSLSKSSEISTRAPRFKTKCKIVVGNISKYIPLWKRDKNDHSTHKWMVYVREYKDNPSIETYVKKVRFLLHPSYRPSDIVEISTPPFHLIKRGWGEFPVRVQLHFSDPRNRPVDIIHNLKLDKTFTGLQTLGSETIIELCLFKQDDRILPIINSYSSVAQESSASETNSTVVQCNGSLSNESDTSDKITNELTVIKEQPDSLVMNIKLKSSTNESTKSDQIANHKTESLNSKLIANSTGSDSEKKTVPKLVISNIRITNKNSVNKTVTVANGLNAKFVKCKDNDGRVLLVPQASLTLKPPPDKQANSNQSCTDSSSKNSKEINKTMPSYIVKVVPKQDSGQKQVFVIPVSEKKDKDTVNKSSLAAIENKESNKKQTDLLITSSSETFRRRSNLHYDQELEEIKPDYYKSFVELLKRVCKVFPLIKEGVDRTILPFCSNSLEEFQSWNVGKQKACEWRRAGMVRKAILNLLNKKEGFHIHPDSVWSQSSIMSWCRKNSFVPMPTEKMTLLPEPKWSGIELCSVTNSTDLVSTLTDEKYSLVINDTENDEIIDIESFSDEKKETDISSSKQADESYCLPHFSEAAVFVKQTASQLGIDIKPVEVEPQLFVPAIEEMILAACQELASDLIGTALNEGFNRLGGRLCPEEITVSDVYSAIKKTPHFDFLTNSSLGIPKDSENT